MKYEEYIWIRNALRILFVMGIVVLFLGAYLRNPYVILLSVIFFLIIVIVGLKHNGYREANLRYTEMIQRKRLEKITKKSLNKPISLSDLRKGGIFFLKVGWKYGIFVLRLLYFLLSLAISVFILLIFFYLYSPSTYFVTSLIIFIVIYLPISSYHIAKQTETLLMRVEANEDE